MNRTELPIASPCNVDWTTMTLADRGRFCGQCDKVVRELAQLTEAEARALLAAPSTEGLCVRYVHDATGEIVFRRDVVPVSRLVRRAAAVVLAAASLPFVAGCMGAVQRPMMGAPPPVGATMGAVACPMPPMPKNTSDAGAPLAPVVPD
jgi:hypothetical protein